VNELQAQIVIYDGYINSITNLETDRIDRCLPPHVFDDPRSSTKNCHDCPV